MTTTETVAAQVAGMHELIDFLGDNPDLAEHFRLQRMATHVDTDPTSVLTDFAATAAAAGYTVDIEGTSNGYVVVEAVHGTVSLAMQAYAHDVDPVPLGLVERVQDAVASAVTR